MSEYDKYLHDMFGLQILFNFVIVVVFYFELNLLRKPKDKQ